MVSRVSVRAKDTRILGLGLALGLLLGLSLVVAAAHRSLF